MSDGLYRATTTKAMPMGRPRRPSRSIRTTASFANNVCTRADTPRTRKPRVRLTRGELDTALQAAAGRTNKQIADDMHLSLRIVESHLQRAYEKLGISGRHELGEAVRNQPSPTSS